MLAYLDCFSGVSGDMLLAALLATGFEEQDLRQRLDGLHLDGWRLEVERPLVQGLAAVQVRFQTERQSCHRHLRDITSILEAAELPAAVRHNAMAVFQRLAQAEATVHGCSMEEVHFHETGALDALLDVVGVTAGLHALEIDPLICSPLPLATGWTSCAHGDLPLPAPAVCVLLEGVPVHGETLGQELVTPTGAALLRTLTSDFGPLPSMRLERTGYGAGSRTRCDGRPNLLRLITGHGLAQAESRQVEVIETHLDDWNSETWPFVAEQLMAAGALDVSLTPMQMKKGRPAYLLRALCDPAHGLLLKELIFRETSTIGVRSHREERLTLPRCAVTVQTPWGQVAAKRIETPDGPILTPEYEDCVRLARQTGVPLKQIYRAVHSGRQQP